MERKSVIQAIAHWAEQEPQRTAVIDGGTETSFALFWSRVQSIAAVLRSLGCGREDCVAVYIDRSTDAIVAIYAALACGSAYVPVDPAAGRQRISYILENCKAKAVLTAGLSPQTQIPTVDVRNVPTASFCPAERHDEDLAYVIYTSGTTGMPKGVMIEERSMRNHLNTLFDHYGCCLGQRVPLMTSHCFDFSIPIVFSLYFGMTLLLCPDVYALGAYLEHERLDFLRMTPSHFMAAADMLKRTAYGKVDHMIFGGEALTDAMCEKVREVFGEHVRIYNEYGPTELTVYTTFMELHKGQSTGIGRPCAGSTVYLLDGERMCAPNEIGELCFAGPNVARGYFADEEKTAERFCSYNGVRLYHTGDLGYIDENGVLYYAGRRDKQIKIRGFRVEPEEVSGVLRKQEFVTDAVVIAAKAANGEQELHAYLVAEKNLDLEEITQRIREDLPAYMIPAAMLQIPEIPLTANGKLDERALPEIQKKRSHTPPRNQTEAKLCALFGELLHYDEIGIDEDFFAMGGNSLAAMGLLNRLAEDGQRITLTELFAHPTAQELAPILQQQADKEPISPAPEQADYPLSASQEQMYWFYRLDPESLSYHMPWCLQLDETVTPDEIRSAMQAMVDRHEILRTRFIDRDGAARQEILPQLTVTLRVIEEETALDDDILNDFLKPFLLEKPPLFRITMLKQAHGWLLLTDMHHIIRDGLSCGIFLEEYAALRAGKTLPMPTLQYKDYCAWAEKRDLSAQGEFWINQFKTLPEPLALPTDHPRPAVRSYAGACVAQAVPEKLMKALRLLEKQTKTTDYMIFLSAAMILMGQYARQEDVVIGSPFAGRAHEDLSQMLGIFINTLPMRAYPEAEKTLEEFLREIRTVCIGAYAHQEYPLAKLVQACGACRESSRNPLYDVILVLQNNEHMDFTIGGKQVKRLPLHQGMSKVDLTFQILESRDRFDIVLEYSTELFCAESAKRILEHYLTLLERMTQSLSLPLRQLLPLSASEREKLINQLTLQAPTYHVAERFAQQAALYPEKIAVRDELQQWSYGRFYDKVTRLAGRLQALGLKPGDFAIVLCERSAQYLLAVMAVLHCGAAFVPVDPEYPDERIQFMIQDSEAVLVLTQKDILDPGVSVVRLTEEIDDAPIALVKAPEESPAYMIYTSGTTGKPKGVMIPNRALSYYMAYASEHYRDASAPLEVALFSSVSFDLTITSTFLGLLNGGTTTVYRHSPDVALAQILKENRTSFLKLTPSHLKMMEEMPCDCKGTLRHMVLGGEVLTTELAHRAQQRYGSQLIIHNEYGPTEATVGCCDYCYDAVRDTEATVSIGKPMQHAQIYILRDEQLCPIGMPGELCIAGAGVALGYKNRAELTAKVFIKNPFGEGLLYRTGDLARLREDGRLEFMGRIDEQVKIRGYRIEPEEVRRALIAADGVNDALVVADGDALCAYVVCEKTLDLQALRRSLAAELPAYMLPQFIMQLNEIPLTINGKVDKAALPKPERKNSNRKPQSEQEILLCEVVAQLLDLEQVSPEEDFFALGGNSLKLMTLRLRLESRTGKSISLTELYREPKLEAIARHIAKAPQATRPILPAPKQASYPMSCVQERLYAIYLAEPKSLAYNHPMGIAIHGALDLPRLEEAFCKLIERHEALRTRFDGKQQYIDENVSFTLTQRSCPDADEQTLLNEFAQPFCLEQTPLMRAQLVARGEDAWLLLTDVHHIAADGISKSMLSRELSALYNEQSLAPVPLQYKDYSHWLTQQSVGQGDEFWAQMCAGEPTELIYDRASAKHACRTAREVKRSLNEEQTKALRKLCISYGVTPYMFFLAAWNCLLGAYTRSEDVTVGTSFAGRTQANLEQTVGMFVHTLLLRSLPTEQISFCDYLQQVKTVCTQAQIYQDESETALREALASCKLFYAFEDVPPMDFAFAGTSCSVVEPETVELPFDMTLLVAEGSCYGLSLQYCTELFHAHTAEGMLEHLLQLLTQILKTPTCKLGELSLVTAREQQLLAQFNDTETEFDREICIADRFEAIAEQYAEKTAVIFGDQSLSYHDFNARANGIAHALQAHGIGTGDMVALICENSMERMLAIWGTIKSGAAYVPIEPSFPTERIESILEDCRPKCVIAVGVQLQSEIPVLELGELPQMRQDNPVRNQKQSDPLYCIYTSGTTGKPKGVVLSNRGLVNLVNYYERRLGFTDRDRVLQFASYCFDASVSEMLMALAFGGTLLLTPDALRHDSRRLSEYCLQEQVTVATFPPNLYAQIETFPARLILTAGSAADRDTVRHGAEKGAYLNAYGPTEASICATDWLYEPNTDIPDRVPIGRPIDNVKIHILQGERPCGIGIPGELCISGESLALYYLNQPELTAEKFTQVRNTRIYRTGDLARWLPDGNLDYLGRCDEQVKLRGFRIELQEIASCLCMLEAIEAATVRLLASDVLCAYYVSKRSYTDEALRSHLTKYLPDYMIPEAYVCMDALPVNTSGKIDTKRLPLPQVKKDDNYLPAQTQEQQIICALFEELLGVRPVGREDDFFRLGGQSLKAMLLMNRLEEQFGQRPDFAEILQNPTPCQLERLLHREKQNYEPIPYAPEASTYPASTVQARFYSIQKAQPDSVAYHVPFCLKLEGDRSRLASVLNEVLSAHEAFRTAFAVENGQVVQKLFPFVPLDIPERNLNDGETVGDALRDFVRPFCMERAPLVRAQIVCEGDEAWLLLDMHHSIVDGASTGVLSRHFQAVYDGKRVQEPRQYHDYSLWDAQQDRSVQKAFWENALSGELPQTVLPYEKTQQPPVAALYNERISKELTYALRSLARETGCTEYMLLLSAVMVVLARYSSSEDITVGTVVANRMHADTTQMVGMFVNTLLMRAQPKAELRFAEFLEQVKEFTAKALQYQDYPFDAVVDYLRKNGVYEETSFLPVMFSMQERSKLSFGGKDFYAEAVESTTGEGKFDLSIDVLTEDEGYVFSMDYRANKLSEESVRRFFGHVEQVLKTVTAEPQTKLSEIDILCAEEKSRILDIFNHSVLHPTVSFLELFDRQAEKTPNALAVVYRERKLTYAQLDALSDRLAWALREAGVQAEENVAIFSRFDEDMFVGALGIMKAGCAYVPVDPKYPEQRIAYMLSDSGARCVVCSEDLDVATDLPKVSIQKQADGVAPFAVSYDAQRLAYVIYTSGSTGKPKGVMVSQGALGNMVQWHNRYYQIKEGDRSCKYASFSFDASVHEMYPQLAAGAQIHIIAEDIRMDMFAINRYLTENHINIGFLPTPICEQFVKLENHSLEKLIAGGDRMTRHSKNYTLYNNYGPTENTVVSTVYEVQGHESIIPIGKPIDGTRVYVLSKDRQLQPIGVTGELALAGRSLAMGYLNQPELTRQRFVDDPFFPGERMYLTGDTGRWMQNGDLLYEGRIDEQYKIRGNRVEIGEIETAAQMLSEVAQCKVRVVDGRAVLYVQGSVQEEVLREHLRRHLPEYMLPEAYVFVEKLRYTVNSKPDFEAMPAPQFAKAGEFVPIDDPIEAEIAEIWKQTLETETVGRFDNFFELGGNSLRITLLHYAIEKAYPNQLSVGDLFANPTVATMAKALRRKLAVKTAHRACLLNLPEGRGGSVCAASSVTEKTVALAALAYSLHRCGKCREAVIYWEEEPKLLQCYTFDVQNLQTAVQLLNAAEEQGGAPLIAIGEKQEEKRAFTVLLSAYEDPMKSDLVFRMKDGRVELRDVSQRVSKTALEQLVQVFAKSCTLFAQVAEQRPKRYPLSSQQSRIYIAQSMLAEKNAYQIPMAFCLPAYTDVDRLCTALKALVQRYDIFRTSFHLEDGQLWQKVAQEVSFAPEVCRCDEFDPQSFTLGQAFDLSQAPLLRTKIVKTPQNVYLLIETHHIIFDGASLGILRKELVQLYQGESLSPVQLQYPACCLWKQDLQAAQAYWKEHFAQGVVTLELPTDYARSKNRSYRCGVQTLELEADLFSRLQRLAAQLGTTDFAIFTAAAHLLFGRYCGQKQTVLGTAMAGRTQARLQNVPGMFVNTVPLTARIEPNESFAAFLKQVSRTIAEAEENQAYPFAELIRLLGLESDGSRTPLIDVSIGFEELGDSNQIDLPSEVEKFDMSIRCMRKEGAARLELSYCLDLFHAETARRLLESLLAILRELRADILLKDISALSDEQRRCLDGYNQTDADVPRDITVCDLLAQFEESDKLAVVFEDSSLSYRELLQQSSAIAGVLQAHSLRNEEIVGVFLPRGMEMYPVILGILKAGGAYLPMDPAYPDARLQYMVKDSALRYVFTTRELAPRLQGLCKAIYVDALPAAPYQKIQIRPQQLAYVIYTSGSSGKPKGVLVEHGSLVNMVLWHQRRFGNCARDVSTQYAGLGFDATVWEIFPYLAVGATIHVIPQRLRLDMEALNAYYEANGITISYLPTQICEQFMSLDNRSLRILHTAGDKLKHFQKRSYTLMNNYGPTENTVVATTAQITEDSWNLPIGRPMDNCKAYVLDEDGIMLPPGARGELCLTGRSVARGYLNRPEDQKFILNPFGEGRMYKTGDLVRWNVGGELEFLGRNDHQVKIRGNRIECGEIETVLAQLEKITQCAVTVWTRANGENYLAAYFCAEEALDSAELTAQLAKRLPQYMVPSVMMQLPSLPLTPNGKLDRAALPQQEEIRQSTALPTTQLQKELASLWQALLQGPKPGIDQSFFSLGGTSILMISLQRAIQERFAQRVTIAELFANPTIEKQELLLQHSKELTFKGLKLPMNLSASGSRVLSLSSRCTKALWQMGEEKAFRVGLTAFSYVLCALSKQSLIPVQGRNKTELFAGTLDFSGIGQFGQALERLTQTKLQTLALQKQGLRIDKQAGQRVACLVWNDATHHGADDRADIVVRLCVGATEASLRTDHPRDSVIAASMAQILEKLCQTE